MPDFDDVIFTEANSARLSITSTPVLAKVGASNQPGRQRIIIYNPDSNNKNIYWDTQSSFDPEDEAGGTGIPIVPGETSSFPFGTGVDIYLRAKTGDTVGVIVHEWS